jgi:acetolactate decarboxylase
MMNQSINLGGNRVESHDWRMEWIGSQKDFIAGKTKEAISLERFAGVQNLYAVGPLERGRGEVSIFDSTPLISKVNEASVNVTVGYGYRAGFLVYAIVKNWRHATVRIPIENEERLGEQLLPLAAENGIDIDRPFPFLVYCYIAQAEFHILCNKSSADYSPELHEKAKVRFPITDKSIEIVGFYSRHHRGVFTPLNSDFHMHVRTLDNRLAGHLEYVRWRQLVTVCVPGVENSFSDGIDDNRSSETW